MWIPARTVGGVVMSNSDRRAQTIAIVGAGEMGAAIGRRLRESGARVITTLQDRSAESVERVRHAKLEVVDDDGRLVREAALMLSIVPPGAARAVAARFLGPLTDAAVKPAYVECNAISPATARGIADSLAPSRCAFIDGGIIGGPPAAGPAGTGPRIYVSGPDAHLVTPLRNYGLDVSIVEGPLGAASALKMSYAGLTKGLIALGAALIIGASRDGVDSALREEFARSQPELLAMLVRRIPAAFPKAHRWVAEMEQIAEFLGGPGSGSTIYTGAAQLYRKLATELNDGEKGGGPETIAAFCRRATGR
jgi:3-hydroxyisobutyrate dehydrogenase-like beta-hydroxyacid dehydrogenase